MERAKAKTRDRLIGVRFTDAEDRQIEKEVQRTGLSRSALLRLAWSLYLSRNEPKEQVA